MKALFIINPKSGNGNSEALEELIKEKSVQHNFTYTSCYLDDADAIQHITETVIKYEPDVVAVAGGDGSVNCIAQVLKRKKIPLLILPTGSANGMAKELCISSRPELALDLIATGRSKDIDLIKINNKICVHLADIGLNARIVKRFDEDAKRGMWVYAKYLFNELFMIKRFKVIVSHGVFRLKRKAVSVTFANASKYGTGLQINPTGKLDDGKFEVVIIRPFPRYKILGITYKMIRGTLHTSEYAEVISCSEATIETYKGISLQIDGEVFEKTRLINIKVLPSALKVIVPCESNP